MKKMLFLLLTVTLGCSAATFATTYNYTADFAASFTGGSGGTPANPYHVWSYGYYSDATTWNLYTESAPVLTLNVWRPTGDYDTYGNAPYNYGATDIDGSGYGLDGMYWRAGQASIFNGFGAYQPGGRFIAPKADIYDIAISFQNNVMNGDSTGVYVAFNDSQVFDAVVSGFNNGTTDRATFSTTISLAEGDTVTFGTYVDTSIDVNTSGNGLHHVGVQAIISDNGIIPPSTMDLVLQLDAGVGVWDPNRPGVPLVDGERVGLWEDQSAGGLLDAKAKWGDPILKTDGDFPVIRFDGSSGMVIYDLTEPNDQATFLDPEDPNDRGLLGLNTLTVYVVGKLNDEALTSRIFFANYGDGKGYGLGVSDTIPDYVKFWTNTGGNMQSGGPIEDTSRYYLLAGVVTQTYGKKLIINDCIEKEGLGGTVISTNSVVSIGALAGGNQFLVGDIAEIRVYDGFIQAAHDGIVNELVNKYSLNRECLAGPDPNVVALTYLTSYRCLNGSGTGDYSYQTNTQYPDAAWDVILYDGPVSSLDPNTSVPLNNPSNMNIYVKSLLSKIIYLRL